MNVEKIIGNVVIPKMVQVQQTFERDSISAEKIRPLIFELMNQPKFDEVHWVGKRICITAGSRGICNIVEILKSLVSFCREKGAEPFLVPAMGSHGGATSEGQLHMLEHLGITPESVGCPILSSMETVLLGTTGEGYPVHIDKNAFEADGIIVCGRVKLHTSFRGAYESGLMKMMAIGLGKQKGAGTCHSAGYEKFPTMLPAMGNVMLKKAPVLCGLAILENAYDETYKLVALKAEEIGEEEPKLLKEATSKMASILFPECDVLIIDEMGKNISGEGSDPNIAGTFCVSTASGGIKAKKRTCLSLTPVSGGNALGIGGLDVISKRLFDSIDLSAMYPNVITTHEFNFGKIPLVANSDAEAIKMCIYGSGVEDVSALRIVRIKNTLELEKIYVSEAMIPDVKENMNVKIMGEPIEFMFNEEGTLLTEY